MRYLFGFLCVCALGVVPLVGCSETAGQVFPCTEQGIRDAIDLGGGPHTFSCDGEQTVTTMDEIVIDNDVILDGEGNLTVDGNDERRVFLVPEGVTAELHGFTVTRGGFLLRIDVGFVFGHAVENQGTLTLADSTVSENLYTFLNLSTLTMTNSTVSNNDDVGVNNSGTLTMTNSTVSNNGGTGVSNGGTLTMTNSTVSNNGDFGVSNGVTLTMTNSTVSNNGDVGVYNGGTLTMTNSTVSGNRVDGEFAIFLEGVGEMTVTNSTLSGTLWLWTESKLTLTNNLVDGNCNCGDFDFDVDCHGIVTSNGYNITSTDESCGFDQETDQVNVTPEQLNLGPLADNGGPTETHELLPGSVAIDWIPAEMCEVDTDQRGVTRPQGAMCDVGSFELEQ